MSVEPVLGEFFEPDPSSLVGPDPQPLSLGPVKVELGRLGTKKYRLCRRIGYRDRKTGHTFAVPRHLDTWTSDLSSQPALFTWVVPVLGSHFNAIVLHDGLVEATIYDPDASPPQQGTDYIGRKISREEVDRVTRDAMREIGTGFLRRWIAWAGMVSATIYSAEGVGRDWARRYHQVLAFLFFAAIVVLGGIATLDVFDVVDWLPWMGDRDGWLELLAGLAGALVFPLLVAPLWWSRWRFPLASGWALAPLLPAIVVTLTLTGFYLGAEWLLGFLRRPEPMELSPTELCASCPEESEDDPSTQTSG